jgi:uncharacterized protein with PIN domain
MGRARRLRALWQGPPYVAGDLNLCDCVAYALAKVVNATLLFKGKDFIATDIASCL